MKNTSKFQRVFGVALVGFMLHLQSAYAVIAGQVQFTNGNVQITTSSGVRRPLKKGDAINEGDAVSTAQASSAQIKMQDGGFVAVRPDTQMKFDKFVFNGKQDGEERSFFSLFKGGFRAVTGLIGRANKQNYKITTPAATIGIRGTDHETFVVPVGNALVAAGAYSKVNVGETTLTTNLGTVSVLPNQMGFASGMNDAPRLAPINTNIFTVSAAPTKTIKDAKEEKSDKQDQKPDSQAGKPASKEGKAEAQATPDNQGARQNARQGESRQSGQEDNQEAAPAAGAESRPDAAPATAGTSGTTRVAVSGAVDNESSTVLRTVAADVAPSGAGVAMGNPATGPSVTSFAVPMSVTVPIRAEPITLVDTSGNTLNTSNQTLTTSSGTVVTVQSVATQVAAGTSFTTAVTQATTASAGTVASAGYTLDHVAMESISRNWWGSQGFLLIPADMTYVTGAAGGGSSSGALSSFTSQNIGGGAAYTMTSTIASGGTATSANAPSFATTGIQYGAWTGYTGQSWTQSGLLGGKSGGGGLNSWMYGAQGYLDAAYWTGTALTTLGTSMMGGTFTYQMDGANTPLSQNSGQSGTLTSASISANFVNMTVNVALGITMPGSNNWAASMTGSIVSGQFSATPTISRSVGTAAALVVCTTCSGSLSGAFTGQNYAGAIVAYALYDSSSKNNNDVSGNVALTRVGVAGNAVVTNSIAAPTGNIVVADGNKNGNTSMVSSLANSTTTGNVLTAYSSSTSGMSTSVTCPTCTSTAAGQVATSGIYYGNWTSGSYTQTWSQTYAASNTPSYWITGPEAGPLYLPEALIGTATYALDAGRVSNGNGVAGTVSGTTALALNFTNQTVGINLDVSVADMAGVAHAWNAKTLAGNEASLQGQSGIGGAAFRAFLNTNGGGSGNGLLTMSVDGSTANVANANGSIYGQLTGSGLTGAIISFNLSGTLAASETIQGVAAFTGAAQNTATSHRYVSISFYDSLATMPVLGIYANNATRVTQDAAGNLTQFDMQNINNGGGGSQTVANNTGVLTDHGSDPVSGISWGRWAGGTINTTDRVTGAVTTATKAGSLHWIAEPLATSAVTLPISGTYTYTKAGGTSPTDQLGNVGTLNSATLTANFTAQTVNLGVNTTVAGTTLNASGANVPIIQRTAFYASSQEPASSTSNLAVTCTGTCSATSGGTVIGKFTGAGATGAAMTYGLQNGTTLVSGVVALHR